MTRDELLRYVNQLSLEMKDVFRRADSFVLAANDTLSEEFQIAAEVVAIFEKRAAKWRGSTDKYRECPLKQAGFSLHSFEELPAMVIGPDGKCICTVSDRCRDVGKRDAKRCTLHELRVLDQQAIRRRAWQSAEG